MFKDNSEKACCGITHIGERGQVVIPKDARRKMGLKTGDKLVTFVKKDSILVIIKAEKVDSMLEKMTKKFENIKKIIKK